MTRGRKLVVTVSVVAVTVVFGVWLSPRGGPPFNPGVTNFVWIEPGTFMMGGSLRWTGRLWPPHIERKRLNSMEGPQTKVTISQGFWMGKYEVTLGDYRSLMNTLPRHFRGDLNLPVRWVSWHDATNYCAQLSEGERAAGRLPDRYEYRLPTAAEWEYACRAGTTRMFSYGDDLGYTELTNYAWFTTNSDGKPHPVGLKRPNPWGLYDMHGNVYEWCLDTYYYPYPGGSVTDPTGPEGGLVVFRGGCYRGNGRSCRSAYRLSFHPTKSSTSPIGFRIVLAPVRPQ